MLMCRDSRRPRVQAKGQFGETWQYGLRRSKHARQNARKHADHRARTSGDSMHRPIRLGACAALSLFLVSAAFAQTASPANPRQLTAEKMWALKRLGEPAITPDGKLAVVPVTTFDVAENKGLTDLWLVPVAGGKARQLTSDKASDSQPTVSPDGKWVAFVSKRGDDSESQIYVIPVDGGEARRVTNI